jgi:polysaccharide pyruvyl transferase WcaK-like protein
MRAAVTRPDALPREFINSRANGRPQRIGLFGYLGSGNIGNDASMESALCYLRSAHPDAIIDAMCTGPDRVRRVYALDAMPLFWYLKHKRRLPGPASAAAKGIGKLIDIVRIASWVRDHDVVIVPGMGVLETTLPLRALGAPYAMFLLCLSGRLSRTKVALVSVGANAIKQPLIRWLYRSSAWLACYVSYRDADSLRAMPRRGAAITAPRVYPDLAFGIPARPAEPGDRMVVGVGVMDFHGTNDNRGQAEQIYASYVAAVTDFIVWLTDTGHSVRLFVGDTKGCDDRVVDELLARVPRRRPGLASDRLTSVPVSSFSDLMAAMAPAGTIVATRYHNVICALRLGKPTISLSYAAKHDVLMSQMGLADYCQDARALDVGRLIGQFADIQTRSAQLRPAISERNESLAREVARQFRYLSALLIPHSPEKVTEKKAEKETSMEMKS